MIIKEILNRRAVREYKADDISEEKIIEIIKAGQFAPTAHGSKAVEFVVVRNQETKNSIFDIVGQDFIKEAPVLIIPIADMAKSILPTQDISVASENMFLQAQSLGLGTVWKNLEHDWQQPLKNLLNIPNDYAAINIIPVGYPEGKMEPHSDVEFFENKIHKDNYKGR
jgi:nitroreductase